MKTVHSGRPDRDRTGARARRKLAALERPGHDGRLGRNRPARAMERHRKHRVENAGARPRHLLADRLGRPGVCDITNRPRRAAGRQPSDARPGRQPRGCRRTRAWRRQRCGPADKVVVPRHGAEPRRRPETVGIRAAGRRTPHRSARQAQPRLVESGHRRPARLCVVRHRANRRARHVGQARLVAPPRPRVRAVRYQLGSQQLARALQRLADPDLLSPADGVPVESRRRIGQDALARRARGATSTRTARRWSCQTGGTH